MIKYVPKAKSVTVLHTYTNDDGDDQIDRVNVYSSPNTECLQINIPSAKMYDVVYLNEVYQQALPYADICQPFLDELTKRIKYLKGPDTSIYTTAQNLKFSTTPNLNWTTSGVTWDASYATWDASGSKTFKIQLTPQEKEALTKSYKLTNDLAFQIETPPAVYEELNPAGEIPNIEFNPYPDEDLDDSYDDDDDSEYDENWYGVDEDDDYEPYPDEDI